MPCILMYITISDDLPAPNPFPVHTEEVCAYTSGKSIHLDHNPQMEQFHSPDGVLDLEAILSQFSQPPETIDDIIPEDSFAVFSDGAVCKFPENWYFNGSQNDLMFVI